MTLFAIFFNSYPHIKNTYMMFGTIIQLLNGDREITFNRQSATTDVTTESSAPEIPVKFRSDIETLQRLYPENFENHHGIVLTLKEELPARHGVSRPCRSFSTQDSPREAASEGAVRGAGAASAPLLRTVHQGAVHCHLRLRAACL